MLLLVLISLAPAFTSQSEAFLNYNGYSSIITVPSASAAYTSASSGLSLATRRLSTAATTTTYAQQQVRWPPMAVHNDWYIPQAGANVAVAPAATTQANVTSDDRMQKPHEAMPRNKQPYSAPHKGHDTPHAAQQQQNPVNYYPYNSSNSGNYRSPAQDMRFVAPYVWAISNQRRPSTPSSERSSRGYVNADNNNYYNKSATQHNKYGDKERNATNRINNADTIVGQLQHPAVFGRQDIASRNADGNSDRNPGEIEESVQVDSVENDINSLEDAQIDEVLVPLGNALDKVRQFCEVFRHVVSDEEADFASDDLVTLGSSTESFANTASVTTAESVAVDTVIPAGDNAQLSPEVQGQQSLPSTAAANLITQQSQPTTASALVWPTMTAPATTRSTAVAASARASAITNASANTPNSAKSLTSTALAIGRGKKLKKKLKKLMLPLLLAYKLKFIALVPLLIGGLTLLVGSTGLAGFFFALFLTVMSLKGGGSVNKSIVIKKVW